MHRILLPFLALLTFIFAERTNALPAPETQTVDVSSAAGVKWEFQPEGGAWKSIKVPAGGWRAQGYSCDAGTYRTTLAIPKNALGKTVYLAFAAVNFGAEVSVGKDAAHLTKVASHTNGWVPLHADVTPYVTPGAALFVQVEVKGRKKFMYNGRYTVPEGATWYPGLAEGILRGVALQILPPVHIDDIYVQTKIKPDTLQAQITVTNDTNRPQTIRLEPKLSSWNHANYRYPTFPDSAAAKVIPAKTTQTIDLGSVAWTPGERSYWWANVPYRPDYKVQLHLLDVTLSVDGRPMHTVRQRFGFRQFGVAGSHYELNGVRCNLRGDNQQEANFGTDAYGIKPGFGPPTRSNPGWPQAVDNLLRLNFNVMRIHQIPATPYMLDVCDEKGLMLVEESPLRGSEGGEDFTPGYGHDNMLNMDRELVLRDRNHPAVVVWSAANEWSDPIREAIAVIRKVDDTRPIIADGVGDMGPDVINMNHYVNGGSLPKTGGAKRSDRPYGETEAVWPNDNTMQGFAWMATSVRLRRLHGDADLRNYVLNNAFPNYVPGESDATETLEIKVKGNPNATILPPISDPWNHPNIKLMQQCYNPMTACDPDFDAANARSNKKGEWPVVKPRFAPGSPVKRQLIVFNDDFNGEELEFRWEFRQGSKDGPILAHGDNHLTVTLGDYMVLLAAFDAPKTECDIFLSLATFKDGRERFRDESIVYHVTATDESKLTDGDYQLINSNSDKPAGVSGNELAQAAGDADAQIWHLKSLGNDEFLLTNKKTGLALTAGEPYMDKGALALQAAPNGNDTQVWRLKMQDDGAHILTNKATGKVLDVYAQRTEDGAKIVLWEANGGQNQLWTLKRIGK